MHIAIFFFFLMDWYTNLVYIWRLVVLEIDAVQFIEKRMQFVTMSTEIGRRVFANGYEILNRFKNRFVCYDYLRRIHDENCTPSIESQREN